MIDRSLNAFHTSEPNDTLAIKSHYIKTLVDLVAEKSTDDVSKTCEDLSRKYVSGFAPDVQRLSVARFSHGNEETGFRMYEEKFIREMIRNFPYKQCPLLQQLVRLISPITLVSPSTRAHPAKRSSFRVSTRPRSPF